MDVFEAIKERRSIRKFTNHEISTEQVERLIEAARWAPSAGNIQPWEFIIIRKPEIKKKLAEAALNQSFIEEAPVVIVVCADVSRSAQRYGDRGKALYCLQDTGAATQNLLLASYYLGLGSCWVGSFREDEIRDTLVLPEEVRPVAIIPVGQSDETPPQRRRRPINEITHYETW